MSASVEAHVDPRRQHRDGLHDGDVAEGDGVNQRGPDPRVLEHELDHDHATGHPRQRAGR